MIQVLHNPRCGKSRGCLAFTTESQIPFEIRNYIENPLSVDELKALIKKLDIKPIELVRQKESIWTEKFIGKKMTNAQIIKAIAQYPILMQRPIVIDGDRAIIGRETEKLEEFLK
ncbi:MAG: ArsC/Spx/MgsR family protein [Flavobacterium sp.]